MRSCRCVPVALVVLAATLAIFSRDAAGQEGLRTVDVKRFGIVVHCPAAWRLITWGKDDQAFVLRLPQEAGSPMGFVSCELGIAPGSLDEFLKRNQVADEAEQAKPEPQRKLTLNKVETIDAKRFGDDTAKKLGHRLDSLWQQQDVKGQTSYELRTHLISDETLYTFTLRTDEAHFDAYRADFEEMLAGAKFSPPETGLQRMPGGFWMQRDFRFAVQLPDDWKPAFGPDDKTLLFATGKVHETFTDNLLVLASPAKPLDLDTLRDSLPKTIHDADRQSEATCKIVAQGNASALETVIHTKRGAVDVSILERRFTGSKRNYEIKFTCESAEFKRLEEDLRKKLDSFHEVADGPTKSFF